MLAAGLLLNFEALRPSHFDLPKPAAIDSVRIDVTFIYTERDSISTGAELSIEGSRHHWRRSHSDR
jgi:hypothetical protein